MGRLLESKWFWAVVFATLFVLSMDFWAWDCTASILGGELTYVAYYFKWLSPDLTSGFLSVVPVVMVATVLLVVVSLATSRPGASAEETVEVAA